MAESRYFQFTSIYIELYKNFTDIVLAGGWAACLPVGLSRHAMLT